MSTDLLDTQQLIVTSFYGGTKRGPCIQLTPRGEFAQYARHQYTQLNFTEVEELAQTLNAWLCRTRDTGGEDEGVDVALDKYTKGPTP